MISLVYETHSTSEDNEAGRASGWNHSRLSALGRSQAAELRTRRLSDGIAAAFSSDLRRAVETAEIALAGTGTPLLLDWRLRECDYGELNGGPAAEHRSTRHLYVDTPYRGGESWRQAVTRAGRFLPDLPLRWDGARVLVIGHVATRWALDHLIDGVPVEDLSLSDFEWKPGWEYVLPG